MPQTNFITLAKNNLKWHSNNSSSCRSECHLFLVWLVWLQDRMLWPVWLYPRTFTMKRQVESLQESWGKNYWNQNWRASVSLFSVCSPPFTKHLLLLWWQFCIFIHMTGRWLWPAIAPGIILYGKYAWLDCMCVYI